MVGIIEERLQIQNLHLSIIHRSSLIQLTLLAGSVKEITAAELENGSSEKGLAGGIGDGKGKWRLTVTSDEPVTVQSVLGTPAGFIINLSTSAQ